MEMQEVNFYPLKHSLKKAVARQNRLLKAEDKGATDGE
jgi:hypothetical protein